MDEFTRRELLGNASMLMLGGALAGTGVAPAQAAEASTAMQRFAQAEIAAAARTTNASAPPVRFRIDRGLGAQAYRVNRNAGGLLVTAGDAVGAMYGGLDIAEALRLGPAAMERVVGNDVRRPHVLNRGIKFNIPLDTRTPSYADTSTAARSNIPEIWTREFWAEFFDQLARHRYNVVSLWSLHPFPSMVRVPEFPDIALNDVWRTKEPLPVVPLDLTGRANVPPEFLQNHEVVQKLTIDQKIAFWREVMQMAADRGIDIYVITWNVFTYGTDGKYGIDDRMNNPVTVAYIRASVRAMVETYPLLKGIGLASGENMHRTPGVEKEPWLWATYGEGVSDALKKQPNRDFRLIHRFWQTSGEDIRKIWSNYPGWPGKFDFSFKYSWAHMYSGPNPRFVDTVMPILNETGIKTWLEVRNDDVYALRWGDPSYVRAYVGNMPPAEKLQGFFMGPDGFTWGRDFLDRDLAGQELGSRRRLVIDKHWYSFMLWGRLSYDPSLPDEHFVEAFRARYPGVDAQRLFAATAAASKIIPQATRFFWRDEDLNWLAEAGAHFDQARGSRHYTVADFAMGRTMPDSRILNVRQWRHRHLNKLPMEATTPLQVADTLSALADETLAQVASLRASSAKLAGKDLRQMIADNGAMAHLGNYYAGKIRGACELALFDATGSEGNRRAAINHLERALSAWKRYAAVRDAQYLPAFYSRIGWIDLTAMTREVAADLDMVRGWRPGQLKFDPNSPADQQIGDASRTV